MPMSAVRLAPGIHVADAADEAFGYRVRRPDGRPDWLATLTRAGAGCYRFPGGAHVCRPGELVLLAPGALHDYATAGPDAPWVFDWAHFTPRAAWAGWLQLPALSPGLLAVRLPEAERERAERAFARLLADSRWADPLGGELAMNALEEVLLVARGCALGGATPLDPQVDAVLRRLSETIARPLSIAELAREVALSPSRLAHLFREQTGESIARAHMALRLRHAARLLEFTDRPVGEIARAAGFESPSHFSRRFKAWYGVAPDAYRRGATRQPPGEDDWL
jgi:AraC family transcriptional regulator of arabinose operon